MVCIHSLPLWVVAVGLMICIWRTDLFARYTRMPFPYSRSVITISQIETAHCGSISPNSNVGIGFSISMAGNSHPIFLLQYSLYSFS